MRKKNYTVWSTALFLTSLTVGRCHVFADSIAVKDGANMTSTGSISFIVNTDPVNPVNPFNPDPDNPVTPIDPHHAKPTPGPLSIDYVSNLTFGGAKTQGSDTTYYAQLDRVKDTKGMSYDVANFVQVTDKRGNNGGWNLVVTEDKQFSHDKYELKGAVLKLANGVKNSPDEASPPIGGSEVILNPGQASDVMHALPGTGMGTWIDRFGKDLTEAKSSVSLFVPGETKKVKGEYATSLTWTLTDTPV
ncbi:WxL domain-containing protein [Lactococcus garvieae]|uniref:WxL domain-containing protein n=1 Tax=Lactococcus garvieae TaxID=1363 RepID=UPI00254C0242|nr:WxL domain-containing protein [Lactococcus garvieae]